MLKNIGACNLTGYEAVYRSMSSQQETIILTAEQVKELNEKLTTMRHNVNNYLSLIVAAAEVIRLNPSAVQRMLPTFKEQPDKIMAEIRNFSAEFEKTLHLDRKSSH